MDLDAVLKELEKLSNGKPRDKMNLESIFNSSKTTRSLKQPAKSKDILSVLGVKSDQPDYALEANVTFDHCITANYIQKETKFNPGSYPCKIYRRIHNGKETWYAIIWHDNWRRKWRNSPKADRETVESWVIRTFENSRIYNVRSVVTECFDLLENDPDFVGRLY